MRLHKTYILRLLIDKQASGQTPELHGALQALEDSQNYPFKSGQALLGLLQTLIRGNTEKEMSSPISRQEEES